MALNFANNNSLSAITSLPASVSGGAFTLLQTQTASSSSTISFTSNIDSTYNAYMFKFYDIHPSTDDVDFQFQVDTGTNTNYNQTITSTTFKTYHNEAGNDQTLVYDTNRDQAQGTGFQDIIQDIGNSNDESGAGTLTIYNPSSSVFVKHFISDTNCYYSGDYAFRFFSAGYINTTTPITRFQFKVDSGTFDGVIKLYGIS